MHDNKKIINRLSIIRGQVDGLIKMIEEDRYCIDVSTQVIAVTSALKSVNRQILSNHLRSCVHDSFKNDGSDTDEKIEEIIKIIGKLEK